MKHPLVPAAAAYAAGLLIGDQIRSPLWLLFLLSFATIGTVLLMPRFRGAFLLILMALVGWTNLAVRTAIVSPYDLRSLQGESAELLTLRGVLPETPEERFFTKDEVLQNRTMARMDVIAVQKKNQDWEPAFGRVLVLIPGNLPPPAHAGQVVEAFGVLAPPPEALAPGLFDYRKYLRRQNIHYLLKPENLEEWRVVATPATPPLSDRFLSWARRTLSMGLPAEDQPLHLLWAMTLGWKTGLTNEVYRPFMLSGTMHVFAISGLHIALITGILAKLLRAFRLQRSWCGFIILPLIWFYTGATGWQPSAVRSTIMMSVIVGGWALRRPSNLANSLAAAALLILLWDPQQLFGASFQLSFFVVLSLAMLVPPLEKLRDHLLATDPLLPLQLVPRWRKLLTTSLRPVLTLAATSVAAWLGSLPLTASYFHLLSPVTLMANMVVVPLSGLALASNLGGLLCGTWLPTLTVLFNHSAWFWMHLMDRFSVWCAGIPGAVFYVPAPDPADVALYYSVLITVVIGAGYFRARPWFIAGLGVIVAAYCSSRTYYRFSTTELVVLPLNGGMGVYQWSPSTGHILFDTGSSRNAQWITEPFLRSRGVNRLDTLVLTHGDSQHVGGATNIANSLRPHMVVASSCRSRSTVYRQALETLSAETNTFRYKSRGEDIAGWSVLHPDRSDRFPRGDDSALVVHKKPAGISVLLLSDLGRAGQKALLQRDPLPRANIVIAGVPADGQSLTDELLAKTQPEVVIVCDADWPASARASSALERRLRARQIPYIFSREAGAITVRIRHHNWEIRTMRGFRLSRDEVREGREF